MFNTTGSRRRSPVVKIYKYGILCLLVISFVLIATLGIYLIICDITHRGFDATYTGVIEGDLEGEGSYISCANPPSITHHRVVLSSQAPFARIGISLPPDAKSGEHSFSNESIYMDRYLISVRIEQDDEYYEFPLSDLVTGKLWINKIPGREGVIVEGEFWADFGQFYIEGDFRVSAEGDFSCIQ